MNLAGIKPTTPFLSSDSERIPNSDLECESHVSLGISVLIYESPTVKPTFKEYQAKVRYKWPKVCQGTVIVGTFFTFRLGLVTARLCFLRMNFSKCLNFMRVVK